MLWRKKKYNKDDVVIKQGDDGDVLYVVDSGSQKCFRRMKADDAEDTFLKNYSPGEAFGELALLYNAPRAATIIADEESILFSLDRDTFNHIVKDATVKRRERFEEFVSKIELLSELSAYERAKLTDCLNTEHYKDGDKIITEGEKGEKFYFIEDGTCKAMKLEDGAEKLVFEYKENDYFGELALLHDDPRAASIYATSDVTVAWIDRNAFKRLLGPLETMLERNKGKYQKYLEITQDPQCMKVCEKTGWTMHVVKGIKEIFDKMDTDNNGTVDWKEVKSQKDDLAKKIFSNSGVNWLWNYTTLDEDKDGRLTFEEFVELFDADEQTRELSNKLGFTPFQVISIRGVFNKMDLDDNGTVEWKEVKQKKNYIAKFIQQSTGIKWGWNFIQLDEDKDRRQTFEEFIMLYQKDDGGEQKQEQPKQDIITKISEKTGWSVEKVEQIKTMFDDMDLDKSGKVTFAEIKDKSNMLGQMIQKGTGISWGWNFAQLDDDKDGSLTFEEFVDLYKEDENAGKEE